MQRSQPKKAVRRDPRRGGREQHVRSGFGLRRTHTTPHPVRGRGSNRHAA